MVHSFPLRAFLLIRPSPKQLNLCINRGILAVVLAEEERYRMKVRYYVDADTSEPHIYGHNVHETEVQQVLRRPGEDRPGAGGARVAIGKTQAGRYVRVIYVADPEPNSVFVITAFELTGTPLIAYRRRRRRQGKR